MIKNITIEIDKDELKDKLDIRDGIDGKDGKDGIGIKGEKGDKPDHKWVGTKLSFEKPNGEWGDLVDLKGKDGKTGNSFIQYSNGGNVYLKTWTDYATRWTVAPTLYDTQPTYDVYEYTYGTTKYYRKVLTTYDPEEDKFFSDTALTILIVSRALSI